MAIWSVTASVPRSVCQLHQCDITISVAVLTSLDQSYRSLPIVAVCSRITISVTAVTPLDLSVTVVV